MVAAASDHLGAPSRVWTGDDGPRLQAAMAAIGGDCCTISH